MRVDRSPHLDTNVKTVERLYKDASWTFFNEFGLIILQINSFNPPWKSLIITSWYECGYSGKFCKNASWTFFNEFGLISYQINSFNLPWVDRSPHLDMNMKTVERFCKDASRTFFNKFALISHQINSFNQLIWLFGYLLMGSSFNQSNRRRETCHHYI